MAIETNELIDVKTLSPFKRFIMTIGNLPTSYLESMTYGEMLMWFCNYLQETVIPTVNNNALAVEELQNLYEELKNYVDTYFENLDVQEEINNKLDEMAEDGTLTNLIISYLTPYVDEQNERISSIESEIESLSSGSPAGVYDTLSDLETADPDHSKIYVVTATGKWYYYDTTNSEWAEGGTYLSTGIADNSINYSQLNSQLKETFTECYLSKQVQSASNVGFFKYSTGTVDTSPSFRYMTINVQEGEKYFYLTKTRSDARAYVVTDNDDTVLTYDTNSSNITHIGFITIPKNGTKLYINIESSSDSQQIYCVKCEKLELDKKYPLKNNYTLGYINGTSGVIQYENPTLVTKSITNIVPIYLSKGTVICSEYPYTTAKYNADGSFISGSRTTLQNNNIVIESDGYYRITLFNYNNVAITANYNTDSTISDDMALGLTFNKKYNRDCYLHISFDDVYSCLSDITSNANSYNSIFDNSFLADLKDLHDKYGCVFTLNTFNTRTGTSYDIANTTTKFKNEFNGNSDWLKFSFHAENNNTYYSSDDSSILTSYNKFVTSVISFAGNNCLDNFIRLGFFTGTSANIDYILGSTYRPHGLFTADDTRLSYYLNQTQTDFVNNNVVAYDSTKNLYLIKSQKRLESLGEYTINLTNYNDKYICEVFTHEYEWDSTIKAKLEVILKQAISLNYNFIYFNELLQLENHLPTA